MDEAFIPGLRLAGDFSAGVVRPLLDEEFPALRYAAARLGPGAEVLTRAISDPQLRGRPPIGAADQFTDSTDALGDLGCPRAVISGF